MVALQTADKQFYVYLLANGRNGALYVGVTSNLVGRVWQHKSKAVAGFTTRYGVDKLVYYEVCESADAAITREKRIKKWRRAWKLELIERHNPYWRDMYEDLMR
jgi:putative endonuclease